jgi:hypothetical protein
VSTTFAEAATRWCPLATRLLGWRPAEFWSATPGELRMSLAPPPDLARPTPPPRDLIARMMERDADE